MNVMTGGEGGCRGRGGKVTVLLSLLLLPLLPHEASPQGDTPVPTVTTSLGTARGKVFTIPKTHAQVVGYLGAYIHNLARPCNFDYLHVCVCRM